MNAARPDLRSPHEADTRLTARERDRAALRGGRRKARGAVTDLVLEQLDACGARCVLDLACGAGETMLFLAARAPSVRFAGIAPRAGFARRAAALLARAGLAERCRVVAGDAGDAEPYEQIDAWRTAGTGARELDLAYAVGSFAAARDPAQLLSRISARLRPGGRLLLCGDFAVASARTAAERRWLEEAQAGRCGRVLPRRTAVERLASAAGLRLVECRDLTCETGPRRTRLRAALAAAGRAIGARSPFWERHVAADALRRCLRSGAARTLFMVLTR